MPRKYNEKSLTTEIVFSINRQSDCWAWKIPDVSGKARNEQVFIPARAFDVAACIAGKSVAIEVKLLRGPYSMTEKKFTNFELRSLDAVDRAGGKSAVAVMYMFEPTEGQVEKYGFGDYVSEMYVIAYRDLEEMMSPYASYTDVTAGREACVKKHGVWNIVEMLETVEAGIEKWKEPFRIIVRK